MASVICLKATAGRPDKQGRRHPMDNQHGKLIGLWVLLTVLPLAITVLVFSAVTVHVAAGAEADARRSVLAATWSSLEREADMAGATGWGDEATARATVAGQALLGARGSLFLSY